MNEIRMSEVKSYAEIASIKPKFDKPSTTMTIDKPKLPTKKQKARSEKKTPFNVPYHLIAHSSSMMKCGEYGCDFCHNFKRNEPCHRIRSCYSNVAIKATFLDAFHYLTEDSEFVVNGFKSPKGRNVVIRATEEKNKFEVCYTTSRDYNYYSAFDMGPFGCSNCEYIKTPMGKLHIYKTPEGIAYHFVPESEFESFKSRIKELVTYKPSMEYFDD
jgi:hypothetical protein